MKRLALLIFASSLFAESPSAPEKTAATSAQEIRTLFSIDPKNRSSDWAQAFDLMRKEKPTLKVFVQLMNGTTLQNVSEVSISSGGTLLFIKMPSSQGARTIPIPVETVAEIGYSP